MRWLFFILLSIFLILFGVFAVTNLQVEWGKPIMGFAALIAGVVGLVDSLMNRG